MSRLRSRRLIQTAIHSKGASGGGGPFALVAGGSASSSDTTHPSIDYGTVTYPPGASRIVACIQWYPPVGGDAITALTIGGAPLTQVPGAAITSTSAGVAIDVWETSASLSGSSGDVQITFAAACAYTSSVVLYGLTTTTPAVSATATQTTFGTNGGGPNDYSVALNIPSGGGALFMTASRNGAVASYVNASIDADITVGGANQYYGHATTTGVGSILRATYVTADQVAASAVAWGP